MATIAVDFDNTLANQDAEGNIWPVEGAREAMISLHQLGHVLIIHTCRTTEAIAADRLAEEVAFIEDFLHYFQIPFDQIFVGPKLIADAYVDDRAVSFRGDWPETLQQLIRYVDDVA